MGACVCEVKLNPLPTSVGFEEGGTVGAHSFGLVFIHHHGIMLAVPYQYHFTISQLECGLLKLKWEFRSATPRWLGA